MSIQIHIGEKVFGGYDGTGNPLYHDIDIAVDDERIEGESRDDHSVRLVHTALETLVHLVLDLTGEQDDDVRAEALEQIGVSRSILDDDDDGEDGNNPPLPSEDDDYGYEPFGTRPEDGGFGYNDGEAPAELSSNKPAPGIDEIPF